MVLFTEPLVLSTSTVDAIATAPAMERPGVIVSRRAGRAGRSGPSNGPVAWQARQTPLRPGCAQAATP